VIGNWKLEIGNFRLLNLHHVNCHSRGGGNSVVKRVIDFRLRGNDKTHMQRFRLLQTKFNTAAFNMALDEVLIKKISSGEVDPSLRFYGWKPAAVSIGYFQSLQAEVDEEKCRERGVDIVRRQTGGGAVFHDKEVTYSMHIPLTLNLVPEKILDSYQRICGGIIRGLTAFNLSAQFVPLNDIIVGGKKISGNAQTRKQGVLLQHGTILQSVDVDKMFDLLKVPDEKMKGKLITVIKERVTSIEQQAGKAIEFQSIVDALIDGFKKDFAAVEFYDDGLSEEETELARKLAEEKYAGGQWNYQR